MECPKCKSNSLEYLKGNIQCLAYGCTYISFHPVTFVPHQVIPNYFIGQQLHQNLVHGANKDMLHHEQWFTKTIQLGMSRFNKLSNFLKLNYVLKEISKARFMTITNIIKTQIAIHQTKHNRTLQIISKHSNIVAYSIYSALFQKQIYFLQELIMHSINKDYKQWNYILYQLNGLLKDKIDFIPVKEPKHLIVNMCRKRNIGLIEQKEMIKMSEQMQQSGNIRRFKIHTVAALVFWTVCQNNPLYMERITLQSICFNDDEKNKGLYCFQTSPSTVIKAMNICKQQKFIDKSWPFQSDSIKDQQEIL